MNMMFCSNCNTNGLNQMYNLVGNDKKPFYKGFLHSFEIKDNNDHICPYCKNKLVDILITDDEFNIIQDVSDSDRQFLEAMIELKKNDSIEYQLKMNQFKTQIKQQKNTKIEEKSIPKCPTCGSTNIQKISGTKRWLSTGLFGLASSDIGKNMCCKKCGHKW